MPDMQETIRLNNGMDIPLVGYGVFKVDPKECERCVRDALSTGYRMIDTAQFYANEEGVGKAISESGVAREDIFLITKVWLTNSGEKRAMESIEESLRKLKTDYVDMLLVHQPYGDYYGTYRALERALDTGKTRSIGLSNFYDARFHDLTCHCNVMPAVNQLETNVLCQQTYMRSLMKETGTQIMAWGPMGQGKNGFFEESALIGLGEKYGRSSAQIALRFLVQQGIPVIPKTTSVARMQENMSIFDFTLSDSDMEFLSSLNRNDKGTRSYTDTEYARKIIAQTF